MVCHNIRLILRAYPKEGLGPVILGVLPPFSDRFFANSAIESAYGLGNGHAVHISLACYNAAARTLSLRSLRTL